MTLCGRGSLIRTFTVVRIETEASGNRFAGGGMRSGFRSDILAQSFKLDRIHNYPPVACVGEAHIGRVFKDTELFPLAPLFSLIDPRIPRPPFLHASQPTIPP